MATMPTATQLTVLTNDLNSDGVIVPGVIVTSPVNLTTTFADGALNVALGETHNRLTEVSSTLHVSPTAFNGAIYNVG